MRPSFISVSKGHFKDIPEPCRYCLYWQTTGDHEGGMLDPAGEADKQKWIDAVTIEFGNCALVACLAGRAVGFVFYAPASVVPRTREYRSRGPSDDAIFVACLYVADEKHRGEGLGSAMLKELENDLRKRGHRAIETFARRSSANNPSGPLAFYVKHGFRILKDDKDFPLVRREL